MRSILLLLALGVVAGLASCSKGSSDPSATITGPNANFIMIPDTGVYYVSKGTVTVTSPDTTIIYDASKDFVVIYPTQTAYLIACNNLKNQAFVLQTTVKPHVNAADSILYGELTGGPHGSLYYYINPSFSNVGTIKLSAYNTAGEAAMGTFSANLGLAYSNTYTFLNTNVYPVTGSFDLKLNTKP